MKNKSDAFVALTVVLCSVVLLGALIFAIAGNPFAKPHLAFTVDFTDVTGITPNSDVLYAGNRIGVVSKIEYLSPGERLEEEHIVRTHVSVLDEAPVPANIRVILNSASMLGEKHIALQRIDDSEGLLEDGAQLVASTSSLIDTMIPGGTEIIENINAVTKSLKSFLDKISEGEADNDIIATITNLKEITEDLKGAMAGDEENPGIAAKMSQLIDKLQETADSVDELINGPEGKKDEGLSAKGKVIAGNLEEFSDELKEMLSGTGEDGEPGLRERLDKITEEIQLLVGGSDSKEALRVKIDRILGKVDTLTEELNALIVWGEYITGTLAEKPNRLIFGNSTNDVPTKEQIIEFLRQNGEPYPVRIKDNDPAGDPAVILPPAGQTGATIDTGESEPPKEKGGFLKFRSPSSRE